MTGMCFRHVLVLFRRSDVRLCTDAGKIMFFYGTFAIFAYSILLFMRKSNPVTTYLEGNEENREDYISIHDGQCMEVFANEPRKSEKVFFIYCTSGEMQYLVSLKRYTVRAYQMLVVMPGQIVQCISRSEDFGARIISFTRELHEEMGMLSRNISVPLYMFKMLYENPVVGMDGEIRKTVATYYDLVESKVRYPKRRPYMRSQVVLVLECLMLETCQVLQESDTEKREFKTTRNREILAEFLQLLPKYYRESRCVGFYADKLFITPKYLSSIIKEVSGKSAKEIIDSYVVLEAKSLLSSSTMSIQQIAFELNFATQTFFGKFFKRHTGISPGEYRNDINHL